MRKLINKIREYKYQIVGIIFTFLIIIILQVLGIPIYDLEKYHVVFNYRKEIRELKADYSMLYSEIEQLKSRIESMELE